MDNENTPRLLVVAGSQREFDVWKQKKFGNQVRPSNLCHYVHNRFSMLGVARGTAVLLFIGQYFQRADIEELKQEALLREFEVIREDGWQIVAK